MLNDATIVSVSDEGQSIGTCLEHNVVFWDATSNIAETMPCLINMTSALDLTKLALRDF